MKKIDRNNWNIQNVLDIMCANYKQGVDLQTTRLSGAYHGMSLRSGVFKAANAANCVNLHEVAIGHGFAYVSWQNKRSKNYKGIVLWVNPVGSWMSNVVKFTELGMGALSKIIHDVKPVLQYHAKFELTPALLPKAEASIELTCSRWNYNDVEISGSTKITVCACINKSNKPLLYCNYGEGVPQMKIPRKERINEHIISMLMNGESSMTFTRSRSHNQPQFPWNCVAEPEGATVSWPPYYVNSMRVVAAPSTEFQDKLKCLRLSHKLGEGMVQ